jgi:hypothetical protein
MGALWSDKLYLLTVHELRALPPWTELTSIGGQIKKLSELDDLDFDIRFGVTGWGISPEEYEQYGDITVRKTVY